MKIGVITKREKATKSGSVMQEAIGLMQSRGVAFEMASIGTTSAPTR